MLNWLIGVLINTVLLMAIDGYFDDIHFSGIGAAFLASVILAVLNAVVRPVLILLTLPVTVLTLPVTVLTLGLFLFVINAITLMMTAGLMGDAFQIGGFGTALLASIVLSFFHLLVQKAVIEPLHNRS
ncbi:phage holin family protein [Geobacillus stearothermophilus]|uniref:phage holin family protein n=1 Tax=Geobacillus stearothermophilus TaxID=1422 RepID=UPI003D21C401